MIITFKENSYIINYYPNLIIIAISKELLTALYLPY